MIHPSTRATRTTRILLVSIVAMLIIPFFSVLSAPVRPPSPASQPAALSFYGLNTYFTGLERHLNDGEDGIDTLVQLGRQSGTQWGREEISWANLQRHGKWWDRSTRDEHYDKNIRKMADAGYGIVGMILTTPEWARVADCDQRSDQYGGIAKDKYWCPPADVQDYANFVSDVVERYDGDGVEDAPGSPRIAVWQLWNEPNHWETWLGSAEEYGNLLVAGYAAAKEADPTAIVATAGLFVFDGSYDDGVGHKDGLYFFDQVLQAVPEAWDSFDALAIHPYMPDKAPDSTDILSKVTYWGRIKTTNDWMTARTTQYGGDKRPIWISEVGWMTCIEEDTQAALSSGEPGRWERYRIPEEYVKSGASTATNGICKTEAEQANYMVRSHIIAHTLGIQHLNYLQLEDKFDTHLRDIWQATAIINTKAQNYEPKVAYGAYQTLTSLLTNMHYIGLGSQHNYLYDPNLWPNPAARYHMRFQRNDGYAWVDVLWRSGGSQSVSLPLEQGIIEAEIITRNGARTPIDVSQGSVQVTIGESPVYIRQKLPIPTPTPTLTPTPSPTFTPSPTLTPSPTPTTTPTPVPTDTYEPDDTCDEAREIGVDGEEQRHTFHVDGDADWVRFQGIMGTTYLVEAVVPPDSPADVVLVAPEGCGGSSATRANPIVSDARFTRTTPLSEAVLVQAQHTLPNKSGPHLTYDLSVHTLPITNAGDVAIIVTEALSPTHPLRDTFRAVANQAYTLFRDMGYGWDQVYYLLPDLYDHPLTIDDVAQAFTEWAPQRVGEQGMITIYLIGQAKQMQSGETAVVVDNLATQYLSPTLLSQWMTYLPVDVSTNVVIESPAGYAFIDSPLSQRGRIIISAADMTGDAWATENGLLFSDYFLAAMRRSSTFAQAFKETQWALSASHLSQSPQLDDNGSQTANDHSDGSFARRRGLRSAATPLSLEGPYAPATRALTITDKLLQAQVRREKNGALAEVYAVIVPSKGEASVTTALTETSYLTSTSPSYPMTRVREYALASGYDAIYEFGYTDVFSSPGTYRAVVYADDERGLQARPAAKAFTIEEIQMLYLPLILR